MSVVTNQPRPFGPLEREKHIQMIFRAFQNRCAPSFGCPSRSPEHRAQESEKHFSGLAPERKPEKGHLQLPVKPNRAGVEELRPGAGTGSDFTSILETVSRFHVTARPELQGKTCACVFQPEADVSLLVTLHRCRSSVCSQEDLQHCCRRHQVTVSSGCGRYQQNKHSYHLDVEFVFQCILSALLLSESSCVCLQCCGPARACTLQGFDTQGHQVFYFERPLRVDSCCFGCCLMEMRAYTPQKLLIGTVCQR